jgi:hypothetical protein
MRQSIYRRIDHYGPIVFWLALATALWCALGLATTAHGQDMAPPPPSIASDRPPLDEADVAAIVSRVVDQAVARALAHHGAAPSSSSAVWPTAQGMPLASPQGTLYGTGRAVDVLVPRGPLRRLWGHWGAQMVSFGQPAVVTYEAAPVPVRYATPAGPRPRRGVDFGIGLGWGGY